MGKRFKVAAAIAGLVLVGGLAYGVASLASEPLRSGVVLNVAWGSGPGQVGVIGWENEPWQGPGTSTTDGTRFYLTDEVNHRIQVYKAARWVRSVSLPSRVLHVKELRLLGESLFLYGFFEGGLVNGNLAVIDLKTERFVDIDLGGVAPGFDPPYSLRVQEGRREAHLVSVTAKNEIAPSFSTGDMLQYVNGVFYEMSYTTDGVVIYQYVLP